jgi:hypothetical protein
MLRHKFNCIYELCWHKGNIMSYFLSSFKTWLNLLIQSSLILFSLDVRALNETKNILTLSRLSDPKY